MMIQNMYFCFLTSKRINDTDSLEFLNLKNHAPHSMVPFLGVNPLLNQFFLMQGGWYKGWKPLNTEGMHEKPSAKNRGDNPKNSLYMDNSH